MRLTILQLQKINSPHTLLSDKNIPIRKRLFMTATPKKFVGSNDEIASMDNEGNIWKTC
jgi:predicted helicase